MEEIKVSTCNLNANVNYSENVNLCRTIKSTSERGGNQTNVNLRAELSFVPHIGSRWVRDCENVIVIKCIHLSTQKRGRMYLTSLRLSATLETQYILTYSYQLFQ